MVVEKTNEIEGLSARELKRVMGLVNGYDAYRLIGEYTEKYAYDYNLRCEIMNKTFISYLDSHSQENKDTKLYEKVLGSMSGYLDEEVLEYLFVQEWDINCLVEDRFGYPGCLKNLLAIKVKYPKIMQLLLNKLNDSKQFYFVGGYYGLHTDLCRMNIVAGNLDKAFELFDGDNYQSLFLDEDDEEILKKFGMGINREDSCEVLNARGKDILFNILKELNDNSCIPVVDKKFFLNKILYSEKIKLFNVANFSMIRQIYDERSFRNFAVYLATRQALCEVSLFSINEDNCTLVCESICSCLNKDNYKVLKYVSTDKKQV